MGSSTLSLLSKLESFGAKLENIKEIDILLLPENIESAKSVEDLFEAEDSIKLYKLLKKENIRVLSVYDLGLENIPILERRSDELWFGVLVIKEIALPIFLGVISSLIANKLQKSNIHIDLKILKDNGEMYSIKYDGDEKTFLKILNSLGVSEDVRDN